MAVFLIIALSLLGVLGDYFIKLAGNGEKYIEPKWFILGTLIFASTAVGWFFAMKHVKLGSLGIIYATTTVLALVVVGAMFFKETLNTYEIVGIITGIISIVLLARFA